MKEWLSDLVDTLFSVDGRFRTSLRTLVFQPGIISLEWLQGRRERYSSPFRIFIVCSALYVSAAMLWTAVDSQRALTEFQPPSTEQHLFDDSGVYQGSELIDYLGFVADRMTRLDRTGERLLRSLSFLLIASIPLLALAFWLLFKKSAYLYLEHLVFTTHLMSFWFLLFSLGQLTTLSFAVFRAPEFVTNLLTTVDFIIVGLIIIYSLLAARRFYGHGWVATVFKSVAALGIYGLFLVGVGFAFRGGFQHAWSDPHQPYREVMERYQQQGEVAPHRVHAAILNYLRHPAGQFVREPHLQFHVAELLLIANRPEEAMQLADRVFVQDPDNPYMLAIAVAASCRMDRQEQAREWKNRYTRVIERMEASGDDVSSRHAVMLARYTDC